MRKGVYPVPGGVTGQLGEGLDAAYVPGPWPGTSAG